MGPIVSAKLVALMAVVAIAIPVLMVMSVAFIYLFDKYTRWHSPFHMRYEVWKRANPRAKESDFFGGYATMFWHVNDRADAPANVTSLSPVRNAAAQVRKGINAHR